MPKEVKDLKIINNNFRDEIVEKKQRGERIFRNLDLSYQDLSELDLSNCDLRGTNLQSADCSGVNFDRSDLRKANFRNANLTKSSFVDSDLTGANLLNANLAKAYFQGADLTKVNMELVRCNKTTWNQIILPDGNLLKSKRFIISGGKISFEEIQKQLINHYNAYRKVVQLIFLLLLFLLVKGSFWVLS